VHTKLDIYVFYYYHWVDTSAGGLLVPNGIIHPLYGNFRLTGFITYTYCVLFTGRGRL